MGGRKCTAHKRTPRDGSIQAASKNRPTTCCASAPRCFSRLPLVSKQLPRSLICTPLLYLASLLQTREQRAWGCNCERAARHELFVLQERHEALRGCISSHLYLIAISLPFHLDFRCHLSSRCATTGSRTVHSPSPLLSTATLNQLSKEHSHQSPVWHRDTSCKLLLTLHSITNPLAIMPIFPANNGNPPMAPAQTQWLKRVLIPFWIIRVLAMALYEVTYILLLTIVARSSYVNGGRGAYIGYVPLH